MAADAVDKVAGMGGPEIDPASRLFFEFASPLLMNASTDQEFNAAAGLAEFIWATSHFSAAEQGLLIDQFINEAGIPEEQVPWLLDVYAELVARKIALVGE